MDLQESIAELNILKEKVQTTTKLLKLDIQRAEMHALEVEMQSSDFWKDQEHAKKVSERHAALSQELTTWETIAKDIDELLGLGEMFSKEEDAASRQEITTRVETLKKKFLGLEFFLLLNGTYDANNAIVALHAGAGGTEAQDWVEMLLRMILRYAEFKGWKTRIIDESRGQEAGYKSVTVHIHGRYAYGHLQGEHGVHRLVRISPFDAEKMRHTSFALIEVLPELDESVEVHIDPKDVRIDTFMSGGHGGQSVNTTYSAVRIVHIPTGITVSCQNERSQLQNKETAMKILRAKLHRLHEEKMQQEKKELRGEYHSAEWGSQIRSYVLHPYKMVKDHRTKVETQDTDGILNGGLDIFVEGYLRWKKESVQK